MPLANLGHRISDQTVGDILGRDGISPAPKRKQAVSWKDFIRALRDVLVGMDFFTTEVLTLKGLTTYYVLFFIHLETRRMNLAGCTPYPDQQWMELREGIGIKVDGTADHGLAAHLSHILRMLGLSPGKRPPGPAFIFKGR